MKRLVYGGVLFYFLVVITTALGSEQKDSSFTRLYAHQVSAAGEESANASYAWHQQGVLPFNELIVSWNALRPKTGKYAFWVRLKGKEWSGWLKYAEWGAAGQQSFSSRNNRARVNVDSVIPRDGLATEFEVKVEATGGAELSDVRTLYACASNLNNYAVAKSIPGLESGFIDNVPQQSQMILKHQRAKDMCSPTSTSTVLSYFLTKADGSFDRGEIVDPVDFAALAHDDGHDIYGNWVLNVAAAYDVSGGKIPCCVKRLTGFHALHDCLLRDCPVVVSVQGPLKGSATPYQSGHLMVVIGWDATAKRVLCIDSAFGTNNATKVWYDSDEFCKAWGRRKNLSYVFMPLL